jgi:hypothetical protein
MERGLLTLKASSDADSTALSWPNGRTGHTASNRMDILELGAGDHGPRAVTP